MLKNPRAAFAAGLLIPPAAALLAWMWAIGWWMDYSDEPQKSDMIVVIAGEFSRPFHAAELYHAGLAPEVWVSRPFRGPAESEAVRLKIPIPAEEETSRRILLKKGVPPEAIRLYGEGVMSTVNEALALRHAAKPSGKKILAVTSRWHARRTRLIFRRTLPDAEVRVVATDHEAFSRRWWRSQALARAAILETAKTAFYLLGGRFLAPLEDTPNEH
ncbi:MAG: YdcF family protein [Elusimicrobiota bacterium]